MRTRCERRRSSGACGPAGRKAWRRCAGDYFTALHKIGAYVQRHPDDPESLYAYAQAREQVEEPDNSHIGQAIRLYLRVLDKQRDNDEARHKLLDLYVRTGFGTEVFPVADALLLHNKNDASALRAKAIASARLGRPDDAVTNAIGYTKAAPDDLDGHLLALDLMFRAKRQPKEVLELTKGWRQAHPDDPRFELLQSVACAGTNDKPGAIEWARRAAGHAPREATLVVALVRQLDLLELFDESSKVLDQATTAAGLPGQTTSGPGAAVAAGRGGGGETAVVRRALVSRWWQQQRV